MLLLDNICVLCLEKVCWVSSADIHLEDNTTVPYVVPGTSRGEYMGSMPKTQYIYNQNRSI